ncbi:MAG: hypothetical protein Q8J72_12685 [Rhodocyclaceae bacterium]|nr:hypothetical protein [Rhodocyclaceae bacterium]
MFFKKHNTTSSFRDQRDAACQADESFRALTTRRESVLAEITVQEGKADQLRAELASRMSPEDEIAAITAGTLSATAGDPTAGKDELTNTIDRLGVLRKAAERLATEIATERQAIGERLYHEQFRGEQSEAASKVMDALLDLAATRMEENHRLFDMQTAGLNILSLPRCAVRFATAALVSEYLAGVQGTGFKPSEAQLARLNGVQQEEARG